MVLRTVFFFSFAFSFVSCSGNNDNVVPGNNEGAPLDSGKTLFEQNCSACHGNDGKLGVSGAKDLTTSKISEEQIEKIIRDGKNGMPPMESLLGSDENVQAVTDYVKSMRK